MCVPHILPWLCQRWAGRNSPKKVIPQSHSKYMPGQFAATVPPASIPPEVHECTLYPTSPRNSGCRSEPGSGRRKSFLFPSPHPVDVPKGLVWGRALGRVPKTCLSFSPPLLSGMRQEAGKVSHVVTPLEEGSSAYENRAWGLEESVPHTLVGFSFSCASPGSFRRRWVWVERDLALLQPQALGCM